MATIGLSDAIGERSPGRLLRRIHKLHEKRMRARFAESDFEEWMALRLIYDGFAQTAGDLAREFGIGTGATTRMIDSLETQGFVARDRTRDDRRVVLVKLTPHGEEHLRSKVPVMLECWSSIFRDFKKAELDQLIALLVKLEAAFIRDED